MAFPEPLNKTESIFNSHARETKLPTITHREIRKYNHCNGIKRVRMVDSKKPEQ